MSLAEAVRRLRKAANMTQAELAQSITDTTGQHTTQGLITNVETGRHNNPSERIVRTLAPADGSRCCARCGTPIPAAALRTHPTQKYCGADCATAARRAP